MTTLNEMAIGALVTLCGILGFGLVIYYLKSKDLQSQVDEKTNEVDNLLAVNQGLEAKIEAENKTAEQRRQLIANLISQLTSAFPGNSGRG